jgi:hypothetical protein
VVKRRSWLSWLGGFTAVCLLFALAPLPPAHANEPPPASLQANSSAGYTFGQQMYFDLSFTNLPPIQRGTLFISTPQFASSYTTDFNINAQPGEQLQIRQTLDLTSTPLQPFATVTYWWLLQGEDGTLYDIPRQTIEYADNQFAWKKTAQDGVEVYWVTDELDLGQMALDVVGESLPAIQAIIPADLPQPLRIYLYPTADDLRAALRLTGQAWLGGHASPEIGVIMLPVENPRTAVVELRRRLPHELTHLLMYRAMGTNYPNVARWFEEGLATSFEAVPNPNYDPALQEALADDTIIPFATLCQSFPESSTEQVYRAYAQSASLVQFIRTEYGDEALRQLIMAFADGADCDTAVQRALNQPLDTLIQAWYTSLRPAPTVQLVNQNLFWLLLIIGGFALVSLLIFVPR